MSTNYYEILGVDRDATYTAIRRAYRKLALELHPDRNDAPDAEERFKQINEAYDVLKDASSRSDHDRWIEWQEQEERRQRRAEADRAQREEAERRREERRRQQAEAERRQREEAERRQRQAEERKQREERVRRTEEERRRRQAEERLREEAGRQRQETAEQQDEPDPDTTEPTPTVESTPVRVPRTPRPARKRRFASTIAVVSLGALAVLLTGILGIIYLFQSTVFTPESAVQPTPDLGATIAAAVAAALPTAAPTPVQTTVVLPEPTIRQTVDLGAAISATIVAAMPSSSSIQEVPTVTIPTATPTPTTEPTPLPSLTPVVTATPTPLPTLVIIANPPDYPQNFRKIHGTGNTLYLKWEEPQYDGGAPIIHYEIAIDGPNLAFKGITTARGFPHPDIAAVPDFASGVTYGVSLTACNSSHCSKPVTLLVNADPIVPTPTPSNLLDPPGPVRNIRMAGSTSDSIELIWEPPANSGGGPIEEYLVMLKSRYETRTEWVIAPYVQFSELAYDNQYLVEIMAANKLKDGPFTTFRFSTHLNEPITTP